MLGKRNVTTPILMTSWRHLKFWPYRFIFIGLQSLKQVFWFILVVPLSIYLIWFNYIYNNTTSFRMVGYIPLTSMVLPVFPTLEQSPTLPISHLGKKNRSFPNQKKTKFSTSKNVVKTPSFLPSKTGGCVTSYDAFNGQVFCVKVVWTECISTFNSWRFFCARLGLVGIGKLIVLIWKVEMYLSHSSYTARLHA